MARKPGSLSFAEAAAVPVTGLTVHQGLVDELAIQPGESLLITGAAGRVGAFAVQIAATLGAHVIGTASRENHAYVRELGAHETIDYRDGDWVAAIRQTHPDGVDAVLECVGGETLPQTMEVVRDGGRVAYIVAADPEPTLTRGVRAHYFIGAPDGVRLAALARLVDADTLKVELQDVFPLARARLAHERIETATPAARSCSPSTSRWQAGDRRATRRRPRGRRAVPPGRPARVRKAGPHAG